MIPQKKQQCDAVIYLVEERFNPSTDYFVLPAAKAMGNKIIRCSFYDLPPVNDLTGAIVIFVRYIPKGWAKIVEAARKKLARLILFMDDDVLDLKATKGLPADYRLKLAKLAVVRKAWLQRQSTELWVSTPYLFEKYSEWNPVLILPMSSESERTVFRRVFYHGGPSTHVTDIKWLRPVIEEAMNRSDKLVFEIMGGRWVKKYYRGLQRVNVIKSMSWPSYQAFLTLQGRHIGLAPLLDTPFNSARSYTKFFEITRSGAVGIYSQKSPFSEIVDHAENGYILELDQDAWVERILDISNNESLRLKVLEKAIHKVGQLNECALASFAKLNAK